MNNLIKKLDKLERTVKHMPGRHDQQRHAGTRSGATMASVGSDGKLYDGSGNMVDSGTVNVSVRYAGGLVNVPVHMQQTEVSVDRGPIYRKRTYDVVKYSASMANKSGDEVTGNVTYRRAQGYGEHASWSWSSDASKLKHHDAGSLSDLVNEVYIY